MRGHGKEIIKVALSLFIICLVTAGVLGAVNYITIDKIKANEIIAANAARQTVVPSAEDFREKVFEDRVYYEALDETGEIIGYTVDSTGKGYGGDIKVTTGFNQSGEIIQVQIVLADKETPGLGQRINEAVFLDQFKGKTVPVHLVTGQNLDEDAIIAVTSATYSSAGVVNAVNEAIDLCSKIIMQ